MRLGHKGVPVIRSCGRAKAPPFRFCRKKEPALDGMKKSTRRGHSSPEPSSSYLGFTRLVLGEDVLINERRFPFAGLRRLGREQPGRQDRRYVIDDYDLPRPTCYCINLAPGY